MRGTRCRTGDAGPTRRRRGGSCARGQVHDTARRDGHQPPSPPSRTSPLPLTRILLGEGTGIRGTRRRRSDDDATTTRTSRRRDDPTTTRRHENEATTRRRDDETTTRRPDDGAGAWGRHSRCSPQLPHSRCRSKYFDNLLKCLAAARCSTRCPHARLPSRRPGAPFAAQIPTSLAASLTCLTASWKKMGEDATTRR